MVSYLSLWEYYGTVPTLFGLLDYALYSGRCAAFVTIYLHTYVQIGTQSGIFASYKGRTL